MAKYRILSLEELQALEKEFISYLILNGIDAGDWEKLKKEDKPAAEEIVEQFSEAVFEKIFRKVEYLEWISPKEIRTFQCLREKIVLVGIKATPESEADFTNPDYIKRTLENPQRDFKIYSTEKEYNKQREEELFEMTTYGCVISDGKLFKALCLSFPQ